jgi:hypothetical protein
MGAEVGGRECCLGSLMSNLVLCLCGAVGCDRWLAGLMSNIFKDLGSGVAFR